MKTFADHEKDRRAELSKQKREKAEAKAKTREYANKLHYRINDYLASRGIALHGVSAGDNWLRLEWAGRTLVITVKEAEGQYESGGKLLDEDGMMKTVNAWLARVLS